jgi:hypothetical protein
MSLLKCDSYPLIELHGEDSKQLNILRAIEEYEDGEESEEEEEEKAANQ